MVMFALTSNIVSVVRYKYEHLVAIAVKKLLPKSCHAILQAFVVSAFLLLSATCAAPNKTIFQPILQKVPAILLVQRMKFFF